MLVLSGEEIELVGAECMCVFWMFDHVTESPVQALIRSKLPWE